MQDMNMTEILLVEDNPNDIELTLRGLKKCNLANQVKVAKDGVEALDFLFTDDRDNIDSLPSLILLDLKLPKVDGIEVLKKIKSDPVRKLIPVVVLTSSDEENDMVKSYRLNVNSFITKPIDFTRFMETVAELGFYWVLLNKTP